MCSVYEKAADRGQLHGSKCVGGGVCDCVLLREDDDVDRGMVVRNALVHFA